MKQTEPVRDLLRIDMAKIDRLRDMQVLFKFILEEIRITFHGLIIFHFQ